MKSILLSDEDLAIVRKVVIPALEPIPGHPGMMDSDDEALWSLIDKFKGAVEL